MGGRDRVQVEGSVIEERGESSEEGERDSEKLRSVEGRAGRSGGEG